MFCEQATLFTWEGLFVSHNRYIEHWSMSLVILTSFSSVSLSVIISSSIRDSPFSALYSSRAHPSGIPFDSWQKRSSRATLPWCQSLQLEHQSSCQSYALLQASQGLHDTLKSCLIYGTPWAWNPSKSSSLLHRALILFAWPRIP